MIHGGEAKLDAGLPVADVGPQAWLLVNPLANVSVGSGKISVHRLNLRKRHVNGTCQWNARVLKMCRHGDHQHIVAIRPFPVSIQDIAHRIHAQLMRRSMVGQAHQVGLD
jgi:hypothetical protein